MNWKDFKPWHYILFFILFFLFIIILKDLLTILIWVIAIGAPAFAIYYFFFRK